MRNHIRLLAVNGVLAALYAVVTILTASFAYGPIQFRVADALCVLPFFAPSTSLGLFIGCLIANLFSTVSTLDIVIGSAATLVGCVIAGRMKHKWLCPLPTILANTVMVGAMLACVYTPDALLTGFLTMGAQVAIGEIAVMAALGLPLTAWLSKTNAAARLLGQDAARKAKPAARGPEL